MTDNPFITCVRALREGADPQVQAEKLYAELTDDERLGLLDGDTPFWEGLSWMREFAYNHIPYVHGEVARLGIPGTRFVDGPRGCVTGEGTAFPVSMARGATWDTSIEERIGDAIGQEVRAQGGNFFGGVCINLPRHPAWGRSQETYGENSYHLGEFGAALTRGVQRWAIACVKHYALNSMENARFTVDVSVDEASLHEVYLPHFRRVLEEGALAVMSAYNSVNGEWAGQNEYLLTTVLRDMWQWDGITVSDFVWGLRNAAKSLNAGLDIEEPFAQLRARDLKRALEAGETTWEAVRRSGVRIIATLLKSYAERTDEEVGPEVMASATHRALAREAAARSMVLLKNEPVDGVPVLPLSAEVERIALIGRLATAPNMGDSGSSLVHPPSHVTPFDGLTEAYPNAIIELIEEDDPKAAAEAAARADVAIIVAGFDLRDEGEYVGEDTMANPELTALFPEAPADAVDPGEAQEAVIMTGGGAYGGDRVSLSLRPIDEEIISAVRAANPRTIVSIVAGGAVIVDPWIKDVPTALMMWYAGMEGGRALADVLTGRQNPSGRLPFAVPTSLDPLPFFDRNAAEITYDRYHGQRLFDKEGAEVRFPLGFGLSYTSYAITSVEASLDAKGTGRVAATVTNRGDRDGVHIVQVYAVPGEAMPFAGERFLVGFAPVAVAAGGTSEIEIPVSLRPISQWNPDSKHLEFTSGEVTLLVGANAHDEEALSAVLPIEGGVA